MTRCSVRNISGVVLFLSGILFQSSFSQTSFSLPDLLKLKSEGKSDASSLNVRSTPIDAPVDAAEYFVGPGDMFVMNIWSTMPVEHQLTVTPEGTLLIPNVGVIETNDLTLAEVKKRVATAVGKKYSNSQVTFNLVSPRKIIVQISGDVFDEGKHEVNSLQRVDNLIAMANSFPPGVQDQTIFEQISYIRISSSLRHIIIQRKNGVKLRADLVKYMATGDGKFNPYLREGDQIFVPSRNENGYAIGITGGVRKPGSYEFVPGDRLSDLIEMGFGFKSTADSTSAVLTRLSSDARTMERVSVNPSAILSGSEPNITLRPGDRLLIKEKPDSRKAYIVEIMGEVNQPGQYPLTLNSTKLSEVIRTAGGFTQEANLKGATLTRARISPQSPAEDIAREQLLSSRSSLGIQDTAYYLTETALRLKGELVSVDFYKLFAAGDSTEDVTLRNYDRIMIPKKTRSVYVFGQILSPGHVEFVEGKNYKYYIAKAAGFTQDARSGDVKIIKGSTRAWLDPDETTIEDGDYVWVPKEVHHPFSYHLTMYAQFAAIIGTVVTIAILINNIKK